MRGGYYHTGDVAARDSGGYITYIGRTDDLFKASDYRISPFELESVLIEHEAVAEAAVVPSPDPLRLAVPKASRGGRGALPRPAPARGPEGVRHAGSRLRPVRGNRVRDPRLRQGAAGAVQADPAAGVRRAAEDHLRQDPPGGTPRARGRPAPGRRRRAGLGGRPAAVPHRRRVLGGRLPRPEGSFPRSERLIVPTYLGCTSARLLGSGRGIPYQ